MEEPKLIPMTPEENIESKSINFLEEIPIIFQNEKYIIKLGIMDNIKSNKLIFKVIPESSKNIYYFQNEYTQDEIKNISKIFLIYENIKDIIKFLKTLKFELIITDNILHINLNVF